MDAAALQELVDRRDILDTVVGLFVATDQRDWSGVESCLAEQVTLDMTSLAGGEPFQLAGAQVADQWRTGLEAIDQVHHQVGNFHVDIRGDEADVSCHGVAYHYRRITSPERTRTFVGSYDVHLIRTASDWRIDLFRFNLKFVTGNLELESAT